VTDFNLKRPCKMCPFRTDCMEGWLGAERAQGIANSLTMDQATFACHETTTASGASGNDEQHCAGALLVLKRDGQAPPQLARIAERLGRFDPSALDEASPVFDSIEEFVRHHGGEEFVMGEPCEFVEQGCEAPAGYATVGGAVVNTAIDPDATRQCEGCGRPCCDACAASSDPFLCAECNEIEED
jgi:hypothetical protein